MCGRYALNHSIQEIEDLFQVKLPAEFGPRYNIAPTQPVLIVRENPHRREGREAAHVVWGLIPPWADDPRIGSKMINARCETAAEKPSFRNCLKRRRCVVPVSGFYEWHTTTGGKQPYFIKSSAGEPLALGGLWEIWDGPNGEQIESCSILTTSANSMLKTMHDRMPVIIPSDRIAQWLDSRNEDVRSLDPFLKPSPDEVLAMHPVCTRVNCVRNDSPELVEPLGLL